MNYLGTIILTKKGLDAIEATDVYLRCYNLKLEIASDEVVVYDCDNSFRNDVVDKIVVGEVGVGLVDGIYVIGIEGDINELDGECLRRSLTNLELKGYIKEFHLTHCLNMC